MSRLSRTLRLLPLLVLACVLPAGSAQAADTRHENVAYAAVAQDEARAFDFAWDTDRQRGGTVDHVNRAAARASCTGCQAPAIFFTRVREAPPPHPGAARAELADVRRDLRALEQQDLPPAELAQAVEEQEDRVLDVLEHDLVRKADPGEEPDVLERELLETSDVG